MPANPPRDIQHYRRYQLDPHHEFRLRPKPMLNPRHPPPQPSSKDSQANTGQRHPSMCYVVAGPPDYSAGAGQYASKVPDLTVGECTAWASGGEDGGVSEHVLAEGEVDGAHC